ncbi:MAG: LuxR C-terminal-related transcriptional regulator [Legionellales bacterium]|jgi:DNA-binding CsgD family transcriptional regulator
MLFNVHSQNYFKSNDISTIIQKNHKNQDLFIGYKDTHLTIQQATENIVISAGFNKAEQICGLTDHELPYPSVLFAKDYIIQDQKVLGGMKLTILDILPFKNTHVLVITTRVPVTNTQYNITGSAFVMKRIPKHSAMHELANQILRSNKMKGASLILDEENLLIKGAEKFQLNEKEFEVLWLLSRGLSPKKIADFLNRSSRTVEDYINRIKQQFQCHHKSVLVEQAISLGILNYLPISLAYNKRVHTLF